jgi:hypothetical protein
MYRAQKTCARASRLGGRPTFVRHANRNSCKQSRDVPQSFPHRGAVLGFESTVSKEYNRFPVCSAVYDECNFPSTVQSFAKSRLETRLLSRAPLQLFGALSLASRLIAVGIDDRLLHPLPRQFGGARTYKHCLIRADQRSVSRGRIR